MKKFLLFGLGLLLFAGAKAQQAYPGYRTGNYQGVSGVFFNPANIVDSRYRWDVNLFSLNAGFGNNNANFKTGELTNIIKDLLNGNSKRVTNLFLNSSANKSFSALANIDLLGPSFMFNVGEKNSFAVTTRIRVMSNLGNIDGGLVNTIINDKQNIENLKLPYTINSNENQKIALNGWGEIGASWGHVIMNEGKHFLKAGITAKYLWGVANNYVNISQLKAEINQDATGYYITNATGAVSSALSGSKVENLTASDFKKPTGTGFGGDIGVIYEYRPDESLSDLRYKNKYKFKAGLAILDLGAISYKANTQYSNNYAVNIGADKFYLKQVNGDIYGIFDKYPQYFTKKGTIENYSISLPTTIQALFDYHIWNGFYAQLDGQIAFQSSTKIQNPYYQHNITLTPRYENPYFGIAFPLNYNTITAFNSGLSLRMGPLFIGSGSILSLAMGKSKQLDFHIGLRFGNIFTKPKIQKEQVAEPVITETKPVDSDGDGITDDIDKCPTIAGLPKYEGCPIPDTDGDGVNDELDKCPTVVGYPKYAGCPIPDTDGDGINDEQDKCPTIIGIVKYQGCPIPDTDGDGINDEEDRCPTLPGIAANQGCPEVKVEIIKKAEFTAKRILFVTGKAELLKSSKKQLNEIVKIMNEDKDLKLAIHGHTDDVGNDDKNQILSEKRAAAVKDYIVSQGIDENRLSSEGFGEANPIDTNKTAKGRTNNRRVELHLSY